MRVAYQDTSEGDGVYIAQLVPVRLHQSSVTINPIVDILTANVYPHTFLQEHSRTKSINYWSIDDHVIYFNGVTAFKIMEYFVLLKATWPSG